MDDTRPGPELTREAIFENSFRSVYGAARSTMLRPYGLRYRTQGHSGEVDCAEDFLTNSRIRRDNREFDLSVQGFFVDAIGVSASLVGEEPAPERTVVPLPQDFILGMSLDEAMTRRRSRRQYTGERISLADLAILLRCVGGVTGKGEVVHRRGGRTSVHFRFTPSSGALYPVEVRAVVLRGSGVDRGVYRYDPLTDRLLGMGDGDTVDALMETFCVGEDVISLSRAAVVLLLVARPWRTMRKYGPRGLRHTLLEAGQMAQNAHLATVALGMGSVDCSSIYEDEAHEVLDMDGRYEFIAHTVVIGNIA